MKKYTLFIIFAFILLLPAFGATARITDISGKVEIKKSGGSWAAASAGMVINEGTTISTGFKSTAVLDLGSSILEVKALTRMTLEDLIEKEGTVTTNLYLRVGRVNAEVKRDTGLNHDFKLRSAVSTAAVRGTKLSYTGLELTVIEGVVNFYNQLNQMSTALADQDIELSGYDIIDAEEGMDDDFGVPSNTGSEGEAPEETDNSYFTDIVITVREE